jgi:hypothetical protein
MKIKLIWFIFIDLDVKYIRFYINFNRWIKRSNKNGKKKYPYTLITSKTKLKISNNLIKKYEDYMIFFEKFK